MSSCIEESKNYDLVKQCCRCKSICLKSIFYKNIKKKDGVNYMCKICMNKYIKDYMKNRIKTDVNFRLIRNTRRRIHHALKDRSKSSSTSDILGIDIETYKKCIEWQCTPEMNWTNIEIDHVKPICLFDVSEDEELREAFNWKNTQPLLKETHSQKGINFNFLDYQLQFIKAYQFLKINEDGLN